MLNKLRLTPFRALTTKFALKATNVARFRAVRLAFNCVEPESCDNERSPIIFIHGINSSKENWKNIPLNVANSTKRKVYCVDLRNCGNTEWSDDFSFYHNVGDVLNFMDSVNARRAIIVGHCLGGIAAMRTALIAPERVEKLAVEDSRVTKAGPDIVKLTIMQLSLQLAAAQQLPADVDEETAKKFIANFVFNGLPPDIKKLAKNPNPHYLTDKLKCTKEGRYIFKSNLSTLIKALEGNSIDVSDGKSVFEGPVCFIYGKKSSFLVGSDEKNIKKCFPNAELVGIENASHFVHANHPREFSKALLAFLSKD